ncbi:hypothetical protein [Phenylobacterium sp.]|uniref:hypothetical protein n=1 Tax=Phenylobacterium sp. TaxID=1871053 RepID=UPI003BABFE1B
MPLPERPAPTERQKRAIEAASLTAERRPGRLAVVQDFNAAKRTLNVDAPHSDREGWHKHYLDTFATSSGDFASESSARLATAVKDRSAPIPTDRQYNAALAAMGAIAPRDELEALIGEQIVAAHIASLDFLGRARANAGEYRDTAAVYAGIATKLSRTMAAHIEALAKLRSGGKQQVIVKHVYVDARGGQNVIAGELHGATGRGTKGRLPYEPEALADLALASLSTMPGEEPEGTALHVARPEGSEALPTSRRQQSSGA